MQIFSWAIDLSAHIFFFIPGLFMFGADWTSPISTADGGKQKYVITKCLI
jgi:hypothetical protein